MAKEEMTNEERSFVAEMKTEREARGWTQEDLAQQMRSAGVPYANQSTVSRIENLTRPVRLMEAQALSLIFGRTVLSMTRPDNRDFFLQIAKNNDRVYRRAYVALKRALAETAKGQATAESIVKMIDSMYTTPSADPETRAQVENIRLNASNFAEMDILAEAEAIYRTTLEHARNDPATSSGALPLYLDHGDDK